MHAPKQALKAWRDAVASKPKVQSDVPLPMLEGWLNDANASVWKIIENKWGKNEILTSLFCGPITEDKAEYILFDESVVISAELVLKPSNGKTSDSRLNTSGSHHEILGLSGLKLCRLLIEIANSSFQVECAQKREFMAPLLDSRWDHKKTPSSAASTFAADLTPATAETRLADTAQSETRKSIPVAATYEPGSIGTLSDTSIPATPAVIPLTAK
jgi:hypothetical protein